MDLKKWLGLYGSKLADSKYERLFTEQVLPLVAELDLQALHAQHPFVDGDGRNRRCDFAIIEGSDLKIAIEVDGFDKTGSGAGMTPAQFVDWQRRQNSLMLQGWELLRFANTDVRDHPKKCAEHLSLLLRNARNKQSHQRQLEERIRQIEGQIQLRIAEERATYGSPPPASRQELTELRRLLDSAKQTNKLSEQEKSRLKQLEAVQQDVRTLTRETSTMKTTIWAMTTLIAFILGLWIFTTSRGTTHSVHGNAGEVALTHQPSNPISAAPSPRAELITPTSSPASVRKTSTDLPAGTSCEQPLSWQQATSLVGTTVAIAGPITRVTERTDVKGQPVFITVGLPFPSKDRLDIVIWGNRRGQFSDVLQQELRGRSACFFGEVTEHDGLPQMVLRERGQLRPL
jgi:hypothetical protein